VQVMPPLLDNCGYWGLGDILGPIGGLVDIDSLLGPWLGLTLHMLAIGSMVQSTLSAALLWCT
jgi:hypothetical protein